MLNGHSNPRTRGWKGATVRLLGSVVLAVLASLGASRLQAQTTLTIDTTPAVVNTTVTYAGGYTSNPLPPNGIAGYGWDFGDGTVLKPNGYPGDSGFALYPATITHTYKSTGYYQVTCTAYTIVPPPPPPPIYIPGGVVMHANCNALGSKTVSLAVGPPTLRAIFPAAPFVTAGTSKAFSVISLGFPTNRVNWSATAGTFSPTNTASAGSTTWTAPVAPGPCTITAASADNANTFVTTSATVVAPPPVPVISAPGYVTANTSGFVVSVPTVAGCSLNFTVTGATINSGWSDGVNEFRTITPASSGSVAYRCTRTNQAGTESAPATAYSSILPAPTGSLMVSSTTPVFNAVVSLTPTHANTIWVILGTTRGGADIAVNPASGVAITLGSATVPKTYWLRVTNQAGTSLDTSVTVTPQVVQIQPINPTAPTLAPGASRALNALSSGGLSNKLNWTATGGTFSLATTNSGATTVWTAPSAGIYAITATSVDDPSRSVSTPVTVAVPQQVSFTWAGMTSVYDANPAAMYRVYGDVSARVDFPAAGNWTLTVTNGVGQVRSAALTTSAAGLVNVSVSDIEAGNSYCQIQGVSDPSFQRKELVVVESGKIASVEINFVKSASDPHRFTIKQLSLAQSCQKEDGSIPIIADRKAMVRIQLLDGKGLSGTNLRVVTSIGGSNPRVIEDATYQMRCDPANTAFANGVVAPLVLPAADVQPGLYIQAKLYNLNNELIDIKTVYPDIRKGNAIHIHPFSVKIAPTSAGAPVGTNSGDFYEQLAKYAEDLFPTSRIIVEGGAEVVVPDPGYYPSYPVPGGHWETSTVLGVPVGVIWVPTIEWHEEGTLTPSAALMAEVVVAMNSIASQEGFTVGSQNHMFVGMVNSKFITDLKGVDASGMCTTGAPGIALFMQATPYTGYTLAHEMGHAYNLKHAPGPDESSINAPDPNYPYSDGLTSGYGYSALFNRFASENQATGWHDVMSYYGVSYGYTHFSDYFYTRLLAGVGTAGNPGTTGAAYASDAVSSGR